MAVVARKNLQKMPKKAAEEPQAFSGFFITGTDTDVGKTYAACCLAQTLIAQGVKLIPRKPIASGAIRQANGTLISEDARLLQLACESEQTIEMICPYQFEPALSPQTAIQMANEFISTDDLVNACQFEAGHNYLVEGAGGFYSPICSDGLNRDLAQNLALPVVIVVKNQLGCINQALLTIEAVKNAGLKPHAVILNYANEVNYYDGLEGWTDLPIYKIDKQKNQQLQLITGFEI